MDREGFKVLIREYSPKDIEWVLWIERTCFPENQQYNATTFHSLHVKDPNLFIVAEYQGVIIGYAVGERWGDVGRIVSIAVHPSYQGRGIGSKLLEALEEKMLTRGVKTVRLEVGVSNTPAINLYLKHGYEPINIIEGYYGEENALVMAKRIKD